MLRTGFSTFLTRVVLLAAGLLAGGAAHASAGQISGRVTSSTTSNGLPSTVIQAYDLANDRFSERVTTDAMGFYTLVLPPGTYALLTQNVAGYINEIYNNVPCSAVCDLNGILPIELAAAPIPNINFVLDPGGRIAGRVTDASTGLGIAGVTVNFQPPNDDIVFTSATTDPMGFYLSDGGTASGNVFAFTQNTLGTGTRPTTISIATAAPRLMTGHRSR